MKDHIKDADAIWLKGALTPPELDMDLRDEVLGRIRQQERKRRTHRWLWASAASVLCAALLSGWFFSRHYPERKQDGPANPAGPQVLVESAQIGHQPALVYEFTHPADAQTPYFWFEAEPQTLAGEET